MPSPALRGALLGMPSAAVAVIGMGLWAGAPRPVQAARVHGGPTGSGVRAGWRVEVVEGERGALRPVAGVAVEVRAGLGGEVRGVTGPGGSVEVSVVLGAAPAVGVVVRDASSGRLLARGTARLAPDAWRRGAGRRGGWLPGSAAGELQVAAAPVRGALAVPFETALRVRVRDAAGAVAGAEVEVDCDGVTVRDGRLRTGASGEARVRVAPEAHAPSCTVVARHAGRRGQLYVGIPVVPGALMARRDGAALVVEAPSPLDAAFVALVTEGARLGAHRVPLSPTPRGASGRVALAPHERAATHAVVSSEVDFRSPSLVGWPIRSDDVEPRVEPLRTFDVRDQLLLDGTGDALAAEAGRRAGVRTATVTALGLVGIASALGFAAAARGSRWAWVAIVLVGLAFGAYALFVSV